jgi:hypothetical protein
VHTSCFTGSEGRAPDPNQFYYPTGLVVSAGRTALYVANSDFDLAYSGGTVQVLNAKKLRDVVRKMASGLAQKKSAATVCGETKPYDDDRRLTLNSDTFLSPGPCSPIEVATFMRNAVFVGAFASGIVLTYDPDKPRARLFTAVRGDPSLTFFEVDDDRQPAVAKDLEQDRSPFRLDCRAGEDGFCHDEHRVGRAAQRSLRGLQLPPDPLGTAASADGAAIVSAHQTQGAASLVVNPWEGTPSLSYFISRLAAGPTELAAIPRPAVVAAAAAQAKMQGYTFKYRDSFALTFRGASELNLIDYYPDEGSGTNRPFLVLAQRIALSVSSSNVDSRGLAIVSGARQSCEAAVPGDVDKLADCAEQHPLKIYIAGRNPAALLIGRVHTTPIRSAVGVGTRVTSVLHSIEVNQSLPLDFGAAHVRTGQVVGKDGSLVDRVFAVAFDAREIFVIDPSTDTVETVIHAGRGPQDVAVDSGMEDGAAYSFLYIAHFTDSYLGMADLDLRRPLTYGQIVATIGVPTPPAESQ